MPFWSASARLFGLLPGIFAGGCFSCALPVSFEECQEGLLLSDFNLVVAMIDQTVIHFHIPKTAGSTINSILVPAFDRDEVFLCGDNKLHLSHWESNVHFAGLSPEEQAPFRYIAGHVEYFLLESLRMPHFSFLFLRNPIERLVSMYYFVKGHEGHHLHSKVVDEELTLAEFVSTGLWHELDNGMCRRLSGVANSVPIGQCGEDVLRRAQYNLENNFSFIGFQERFDESLFLLLSFLDALDGLDYQSQNVTDKRKKAKRITSEEKKALMAVNSLDLELYAFGRELYRSRYAPFLQKFARPLESFKKALSLKKKTV